jgi:hypothetical protein
MSASQNCGVVPVQCEVERYRSTVINGNVLATATWDADRRATIIARAAPTFGFARNAPSLCLECRPICARSGAWGLIVHNLLFQVQSPHRGASRHSAPPVLARSRPGKRGLVGRFGEDVHQTSVRSAPTGSSRQPFAFERPTRCHRPVFGHSGSASSKAVHTCIPDL